MCGGGEWGSISELFFQKRVSYVHSALIGANTVYMLQAFNILASL